MAEFNYFADNFSVFYLFVSKISLQYMSFVRGKYTDLM